MLSGVPADLSWNLANVVENGRERMVVVEVVAGAKRRWDMPNSAVRNAMLCGWKGRGGV